MLSHRRPRQPSSAHTERLTIAAMAVVLPEKAGAGRER